MNFADKAVVGLLFCDYFKFSALTDIFLPVKSVHFLDRARAFK